MKSYILSCDLLPTWNQGAVSRSFGFDTIVTAENFCYPNTAAVMHDREFFSAAVKRMSSGEIWPDGEKAFVTFITHSGHAPFENPETTDSLDLKGDYPSVLRDYLIVSNYVDRQLKVLFDYLRSREDWSETAVFITGDHEGLASWRADIASKCGFVDSGQHTPLLILNAPRHGVDSVEITQADVYSALLEIMGIYDKAEWRGMGYPPIFPVAPTDTILRDVRRVGDLILRHPELKP